MPQAFLESGIRRRSLHLAGCRHHGAGEPLFNDIGCPQCGSPDNLTPDSAWGGRPDKLRCTNCGLSGIRPHFAGVEEGEGDSDAE